jgi:heat-inducible transcriptional repressor
MLEPDPLDERKRQVLKAVVDDYTATAVPVGSQQLAARYFARWSSATIRNELAHLMESGHLRQPHTSSGRVPSDRGYRYFVDFLMGEDTVDAGLRDSLERFFLSLPADVEAILEGTAMAVARASDGVGLVSAPRAQACQLKYVDLVHLDGSRILALVVLEGNLVRQQPVELPATVTQEDLSRFAGRLNLEAKGDSAAELEALLAATPLLEWERVAGTAVAEFMQAYDASTATVIVHDGVRNLVRQPEFLEADKLLPVLELLEESRQMARVLENLQTADHEVGVVIGDENPERGLRECSMVVTSYSAVPGSPPLGGEVLPGGVNTVRGTLGSLGPTRMRYGQVVARLRLISRLAGDAIGRLYA